MHLLLLGRRIGNTEEVEALERMGPVENRFGLPNGWAEGHVTGGRLATHRIEGRVVSGGIVTRVGSLGRWCHCDRRVRGRGGRDRIGAHCRGLVLDCLASRGHGGGRGRNQDRGGWPNGRRLDTTV